MARVHILGSGGPVPTPTRFGSSYVVETAGTRIMVDCGPAATDKLVKAGLSPTDISHLLFTHHHFDHDVDLPCFLLSRWNQSLGKEGRLKVLGPAPTRRLTEGIIGEAGLFAHDWKARVNHPLSQRLHVLRGGTLPRRPPEADATDVGPGRVLSGADWEVTAAPAVHVEPYLDSLAYRLDGPEGSIVFTGDTEPCQSVVDLARSADVMVCMSSSSQEEMDRSGTAMGCCSPTGAARMAQEAGVRKLLLVHIGGPLAKPGAMERAIGDAKKVYDGQLVFTHELMALDLP